MLFLIASNFMCSKSLLNLFQLFTNSMVEAGLIDNPRILLASLNKLLTAALEKH